MGYRPRPRERRLLDCAVFHITADLEREIWGEIMSDSVAAHVSRCFFDPYLIVWSDGRDRLPECMPPSASLVPPGGLAAGVTDRTQRRPRATEVGGASSRILFFGETRERST